MLTVTSPTNGGNVVNEGFRYYTNPSFWDDYRNKLVLLGMISPDVTTDIIKSITDKGEKRGGYMPIFFHGDHASVFVAGSWLRGITGFDLERAYKLLLKMQLFPVSGRPYLDEYLKRGDGLQKKILPTSPPGTSTRRPSPKQWNMLMTTMRQH